VLCQPQFFRIAMQI